MVLKGAWRKMAGNKRMGLRKEDAKVKRNEKFMDSYKQKSVWISGTLDATCSTVNHDDSKNFRGQHRS